MRYNFPYILYTERQFSNMIRIALFSPILVSTALVKIIKNLSGIKQHILLILLFYTSEVLHKSHQTKTKVLADYLGRTTAVQ